MSKENWHVIHPKRKRKEKWHVNKDCDGYALSGNSSEVMCSAYILLSFSPSGPSEMGCIPWIGSHDQGIYETGILLSSLEAFD